ncbi:uncharacterized protein DS421_17g596680 [Arachis hypogaea]|nr:uncharacterized protein DS421_17g596680 [Arachis hypogaea]
MSEPKKTIVRELDFGRLMHIPPINVPHKLLKELGLGKNTLETSYGSFKVKPKTIRTALGLNASGDLFLDKVSYKNLSKENKLIFKRFQGNTLKKLTDDMMSIGVENEQDRLMFKRIFILYIQMAFLFPTTISKLAGDYVPVIPPEWDFPPEPIPDFSQPDEPALPDGEVAPVYANGPVLANDFIHSDSSVFGGSEGIVVAADDEEKEDPEIEIEQDEEMDEPHGDSPNGHV